MMLVQNYTSSQIKVLLQKILLGLTHHVCANSYNSMTAFQLTLSCGFFGLV